MHFPKMAVTAESIACESVDFAVEVARQFGDERPAALDVVVANASETPTTITAGGVPPLSTPCTRHTDGDALVCLVPDGRSADQTGAEYRDLIPETPDEDGYWRISGSFTVPDVGVVFTLDPGETFRGSYAVLAGPAAERLLARGTYRFADNLGIGPSPEEATFVSLAFDLAIE